MSARRASPGQLDRILGHAVTYALLGSLGACRGVTGIDADSASAGSASTPTSMPDSKSAPAIHSPGGTPLSCSPDGESPFERMRLARAFDYLALRKRPQLGGSVIQSSSQWGVPCATAHDPATCRQALDAAGPRLDSPWRHCTRACVFSGVVANVGDEVLLFDSADTLQVLLGPIDTPEEAALLANARGYSADCDQLRYKPEADGFTLITTERVALCPIKYAELTLQVSSAGAVVELGRKEVQHEGSGACVGRRPEGLELTSPARCNVTGASASLEVGAFFAEVAQLEESAVSAFEVMGRELAALGAPRSLRRATARAVRDERRHTAVTARLARRYGVEPEHPRIQEREGRALFEFALDNVIEGCVRETYGAACARYQSLRAADPGVRVTLARIARDEARHADLSWRIHEWARERLSGAELERLRHSARRAIDELRREVAREPADSVRQLAGMPGPAHALAMLDLLEAQLWNSRQLGAC